MNLHDQLEHDLHSYLPDDSLVGATRFSQVARSQGTRALRRRRAAVAVAGLAAATVLGVSVLSYGGGSAGLPVSGSGADPAATSPRAAFDPAHPGPAGPTTGRGLAAALQWALTDLQAGTATAFGGQAGHESHASLRWSPADGTGVSQVDVNVQDLPEYDGVDGSCPPADAVVRCRVATLGDGSLLKTYEDHATGDGETGILRQVTIVRPDGVRVGVSATNGLTLPGGDWDVTRPQPPFTTAQLVELAQQPFWGATLPTAFLAAGRDLQPYDAQGTRWPDAADGS